ncbi:hypothetical protein SAMN04488498_11213 [Mesorhizobium albiziae]|uniref:Uncharacterized protein n=1 Tax=Neomesorhizobium albiziae TaxID=335020 RepID=A0A1I4C5D3_9HYPH|nr:hypothetical protein [Mesorhizobium albiziae]GLS29418.1 hypothetical protein GCM10007937_11260 [Mesorhizobium albiziae]SFK76155.1 hypothetical protein SAMN04488498_11213 [Mesorhizobium albiziae]
MFSDYGRSAFAVRAWLSWLLGLLPAAVFAASKGTPGMRAAFFAAAALAATVPTGFAETLRVDRDFWRAAVWQYSDCQKATIAELKGVGPIQKLQSLVPMTEQCMDLFGFSPDVSQCLHHGEGYEGFKHCVVRRTVTKLRLQQD